MSEQIREAIAYYVAQGLSEEQIIKNIRASYSKVNQNSVAQVLSELNSKGISREQIINNLPSMLGINLGYMEEVFIQTDLFEPLGR